LIAVSVASLSTVRLPDLAASINTDKKRESNVNDFPLQRQR